MISTKASPHLFFILPPSSLALPSRTHLFSSLKPLKRPIWSEKSLAFNLFVAGNEHRRLHPHQCHPSPVSPTRPLCFLLVLIPWQQGAKPISFLFLRRFSLLVVGLPPIAVVDYSASTTFPCLPLRKGSVRPSRGEKNKQRKKGKKKE